MSMNDLLVDMVTASFPDAYCDDCGGVRAAYYDDAVGFYYKFDCGEPEPCCCEDEAPPAGRQFSAEQLATIERIKREREGGD